MKVMLTLAAVAMLVSCSAGNKVAETSAGADSATADAGVVFNADSAYYFVESQVAFGPRVPGSDAHKRCGQYIVSSLERFGADTVMVQTGTMTAYSGKVLPISNIMGRFNTSAKRRVLVAAHYDTRPWADEEADETKQSMPIPGANDGASGVGVVLELARQVGLKHPDVGVDFLLVDAEDSGMSGGWSSNEETWCLGTQYWVRNLPYATAAERPAFGILLDMVGGDGAVFYREYMSERLAPEVNTKVWGAAARSAYADRFNNSVSGSLIDDHLFINRAGIPCIDIVECNNPATGAFPPSWHTLDDDMHNIDRATLKAVGQVVTDVIYGEPGAE